MTSNAISALFDVNVWLALAADNHRHYRAAHAALPDLPAPVFCRFTQAGFLRLLTNSHAMGRNTCTPAQAWSLYEKIFQSLEASFEEEPSGLEHQWRAFVTKSERTSGSAWNDAYLAAFALRAGMPLVTFDRGFNNFPGLDCRVL
ncbi:MAG: TA system VapC family ribonuclease toxin [Opitutales bacterium]|jgi:toxin-antitoxin system PIN domain toxin